MSDALFFVENRYFLTGKSYIRLAKILIFQYIKSSVIKKGDRKYERQKRIQTVYPC